mgnify:CR=1 FL=1
MKREKTTKVYWRESKVETYHADAGKPQPADMPKSNVTVTKNVVVRTRKTQSVELTIEE